MDIPAGLMPGAWLLGGGFVYLLLMLAALLTAPWSKVRDSEAQHIFLGTIVAISLLWILRGGIQPGLSYHLLGMTLLCLMFEWQFALFAASAVLAAATWQGEAGWEAYGLNALLLCALPVLITRLLLYAGQCRLPHNYFVYIFFNAFFAGALSILLAGSASALVQHVTGVQPEGTIARNFLQVLPMLMFGEGFINGGALTLIVAYRPHWVATFHDRWYLKGK